MARGGEAYLRMRVKGVDVEVDSMHCRARRVSGVASVLALGFGEFVATSSLSGGYDANKGCEEASERKKDRPLLPYL